jgi:hypothetical protein
LRGGFSLFVEFYPMLYISLNSVLLEERFEGHMAATQEEEASTKEQWVTTMQAIQFLSTNQPKFKRMREHYHFKVRKSWKDARIKYVDINEIRSKLGI